MLVDEVYYFYDDGDCCDCRYGCGGDYVDVRDGTCSLLYGVETSETEGSVTVGPLRPVCVACSVRYCVLHRTVYGTTPFWTGHAN